MSRTFPVGAASRAAPASSRSTLWAEANRAVGPRRGPATVALLSAALLLFTPSAFAQAPALPPNNQETQLFRGLFHFHEIKPVTLAEARADPRNLIVVVFGEPRNVEVARVTRDALSNGGAVLIAANSLQAPSSYFPSGGELDVSRLRVNFPVQQNPGGLVTYIPRGAIQPVPVSEFEGGLGRVLGPAPEMELFTPYQRIEVQSASYLSLSKRPAELTRIVARFPAGAAAEQAGPPVPLTPQQVFAAAGAGRRDNPFRCVLMAGGSPFWNQLLYTSGRLQDPTDNLRFANTLVQWLKGPEGRTRCLFVESGTVMTKFDEVKYSAIPIGPPTPPVPVPNIDPFNEEFQQKVTDTLNTGIQQSQDDNRMNKALADTDDRKAAVYRTLAVLAAIALAALIALRALRGRFRALFRPIPKDPQRLGPDTVVGSVEHRRLELLRGGDYGRPVRSYIRQLFEERGLPAGYDGAWPPRFRFDLRNREFVKRALTTLWDELNSPKPINYARWKELEPLLTAARASADDNRWWIDIPADDEGAA